MTQVAGLVVLAAATLAAAFVLVRLLSELDRLGRGQEALRAEVQRGREASLSELAGAAQGIRSDLGEAQRVLSEVRAVESARARQMEQAAESLRRLEAVVAGTSARGAAGESILARSLLQLPPDLIETQVPFGSRVVEFALRLPDGRLLPIDSKWTSAPTLERLAESRDPQEQRKLADAVCKDVRLRAREVGKYLDPERTIGLALVAVPDAVHAFAAEVQSELWRDGVLLVPYSLALPFALALYRLVARFSAGPEAGSLAPQIQALVEALQRLEDESEGRLSRALVQAGNARDALRDHAAAARRAAERLSDATQPIDSPSGSR